MWFPRKEYWSMLLLPFPPPGDFFWPRDWTQICYIGRQNPYHWATWEAEVENCNQQLSSETASAAQAWSPFLSELTLSWHLLENHWLWPLIRLAHLYLFHHTQRVLFFWKSLVKLFCLAWALRDLLFSCQVMSNSLQPHGLSTPGFPVLHYLLEFVQTQVHWNGDAIQLSHSLSSISPPALNLSQHQGLFQWVGSLHQVAKILELQHQSFQWVFKFDFL